MNLQHKDQKTQNSFLDRNMFFSFQPNLLFLLNLNFSSKYETHRQTDTHTHTLHLQSHIHTHTYTHTHSRTLHLLFTHTLAQTYTHKNLSHLLTFPLSLSLTHKHTRTNTHRIIHFSRNLYKELNVLIHFPASVRVKFCVMLLVLNSFTNNLHSCVN